MPTHPSVYTLTSPLSGMDSTEILQVYSKTLPKTFKTAMIIKAGRETGLMAQRVKALAPKSDDLSSIPDIHMVEGGK